MTEERIEAAAERMGEAIEKTVENAADRLDRAANRAWAHRPVRIVCRSLCVCTGVGLMAGALPLLERGSRTAAKLCLAAGGLVILCEIAQSVFIKRK